MSIRFRCACGQAMKMAEQYAGKRAKCPACGKVLSVPAASEFADGSSVALPASAPKAAAKAPAHAKTTVTTGDFAEHAPEAPHAPAAATATRCPGCGKALSAGARICITCGFDLQSGKSHATRAGVKDRNIAATDERGPWFSIAGIEFTTGKLIFTGAILAGILGVYFLILAPAKASRAIYDALTKKHDRALVQMVNLKLQEVGPQDTVVVNIWFDEPTFMVSVPAELAFFGHVADKASSITVDTMSGSYDYKTGQLKMRLPNPGIDKKIDVVVTLPPEGDGATVPVTIAPPTPGPTPKPAVKPVKPPVPLPEGSTSWDLENKSVVTVHVTPWPARASAPSKIIVTAGIVDRAAAFTGKVWYRLAKEEVGTGEWTEMKPTVEGTIELDAAFDADATLPAGMTFVQIKVQRTDDAKATELTDWSVMVGE